MKTRRIKSAAESREALDLGDYVPFYLNSISNKLTHGASRLYMQQFGIGIIEWRIIGFLKIKDGASANEICQTLGIDKAAVSRGLRALEDKGLISIRPVNGRQRALYLTTEGARLHRRILPLALGRERILLSQLSEEEHGTLLDLLKKLDAGLNQLEQTEQQAARP